MATKDTSNKYGIKILFDKGPTGWVVGKDSDIMLFADKATATATLKKMKADDRYSWNCETVIAEFTGWVNSHTITEGVVKYRSLVLYYTKTD